MSKSFEVIIIALLLISNAALGDVKASATFDYHGNTDQWTEVAEVKFKATGNGVRLALVSTGEVSSIGNRQAPLSLSIRFMRGETVLGHYNVAITHIQGIGSTSQHPRISGVFEAIDLSPDTSQQVEYSVEMRDITETGADVRGYRLIAHDI